MATINPAGKTVKYKYGSREAFSKLNKIFQKVEMYIDEEGCFYVVPIEENDEIIFKDAVFDDEAY